MEERKVRSPESISYEAHAHCLLHGLELSGEEEARCWEELHEILKGCSRATATSLEENLFEPSSASSEARRAQARLHFVAALAEWVNMHDLHKPYAMGPPGKEQRCAHVDDEHSAKEMAGPITIGNEIQSYSKGASRPSGTQGARWYLFSLGSETSIGGETGGRRVQGGSRGGPGGPPEKIELSFPVVFGPVRKK